MDTHAHSHEDTHNHSHNHPHEHGWQGHARDTILCALGLGGGFLVSLIPEAPPALSLALYILAMIAGGRDPAIDAFEKLRKGVLDIHFLMVAVAIGATAVGAYIEGALLLFLFSLSGTLEHYAEERTQREIRALFKSTPKEALRLRDDGSQERVSVQELGVGETVLVKPGELFPVDATVTQGQSEADESALTGESIPVAKTQGDPLYGGTLNLWGSIRAKVARPADDSALQKIIRLVEEARHTKARAQRFTDKFGTGYTWLVLLLTTLAFLIWWLGFGIPAFENSEEEFSAFYRAMTLLVVASPCALVLSIPSAILAAIAAGARQGILFKGGSSIEKLSEIHTICLDKTGTLTTGELEVERVESYPPGQESQILRTAHSLEAHSAHPLAHAIARHAQQQDIEVESVDDFQSHNGLGLSGKIESTSARLGRREWLLDSLPKSQSLKDQTPFPEPGFTEVWVCRGDTVGRLLLRDRIRTESAPVIRQIHAWGLQAVMLTGDRPESALSVAETIGLKPEEIHAGLSPAEKVEHIRAFENAGKHVAMLGDGVNDAPCLAAAYVSLGMGARGSDAALEESEIVLMEDKIEKFLTAYTLSRRARAIIRQNLAVSLGTIVIMVGASLFGLVPLTLGVIAHEGSTVIVCLNSLRLILQRS